MANKYYHIEYLISIYTYHTCVFYRSIFLGHSLQKYSSTIVSPSALVLLYDEVQSLHMHVVFQQQHWVSELKILKISDEVVTNNSGELKKKPLSMLF